VVLLQKLTLFQLVKKFPAFYGTPRFKTLFCWDMTLHPWAIETNCPVMQCLIPEKQTRSLW
jgi:hypothetical protein